MRVASSLAAFRDFNDMLGILEHLLIDCSFISEVTARGIGVLRTNKDNNNNILRKQLYDVVISCKNNDSFLLSLECVLDLAFNYRNNVKNYIYPDDNDIIITT